MKTIAVHGGNGNHAQDIIQRWIFSDFDINIVDIWDPIPTQNIDAHMIFLPIDLTRRRIQEIHFQNPHTPIINFSGIQSTTPSKLIQNWVVSNIHFLFGPNMTWEGLKASLASTKIHTVISQVLQKVEALWIKVLTHTVDQHDEKVAITQGFAHALFLAMSEAHILPQLLFDRWKAVPSTTSWWMIHYNIGNVEDTIISFISHIERWLSFREAFQQIVKNGDIKEFTTPNFERILKAIMWENGPETNISEEILETKKWEILDNLKVLLGLHQVELVELIEQTRNGK